MMNQSNESLFTIPYGNLLNTFITVYDIEVSDDGYFTCEYELKENEKNITNEFDSEDVAHFILDFILSAVKEYNPSIGDIDE